MNCFLNSSFSVLHTVFLPTGLKTITLGPFLDLRNVKIVPVLQNSILCAKGESDPIKPSVKLVIRRVLFKFYFPLRRATGAPEFLLPATTSSGHFSIFLARRSINGRFRVAKYV